MSNYDIKVTEYGIERGNKIYPSHYNWDYCVENKIPYIIIRPKIKYSNIDYDLFTVDTGLSFPENNKLIYYWWNIYEDYIKEVSFPKERIPLRIIGEVTNNFNVFKVDQERMVQRLMKEIESFVNKFALFDFERKTYYDRK